MPSKKKPNQKHTSAVHTILAACLREDDWREVLEGRRQVIESSNWPVYGAQTSLSRLNIVHEHIKQYVRQGKMLLSDDKGKLSWRDGLSSDDKRLDSDILRRFSAMPLSQASRMPASWSIEVDSTPSPVKARAEQSALPSPANSLAKRTADSPTPHNGTPQSVHHLADQVEIPTGGSVSPDELLDVIVRLQDACDKLARHQSSSDYRVARLQTENDELRAETRSLKRRIEDLERPHASKRSASEWDHARVQYRSR